MINGRIADGLSKDKVFLAFPHAKRTAGQTRSVVPLQIKGRDDPVSVTVTDSGYLTVMGLRRKVHGMSFHMYSW